MFKKDQLVLTVHCLKLLASGRKNVCRHVAVGNGKK